METNSGELYLKLAVFGHVSYVFMNLSGTWLDDKASGHGVLEYNNGDLFEGQWEADQRHGEW